MYMVTIKTQGPILESLYKLIWNKLSVGAYGCVMPDVQYFKMTYMYNLKGRQISSSVLRKQYSCIHMTQKWNFRSIHLVPCE